MPLPVGVIKTGRMAFVLCSDKLDALARQANQIRRCKRCFYFDPGDGSTPGVGLCSLSPPTPVVMTQANWAEGQPQSKESWLGMKNKIEFLRPQVSADWSCCRFTRYRLIAGLWGRG